MGVKSDKGGSGTNPVFRRATSREVAALVGVSVATVSNAYNRPDQLSEGLRGRIFEAAEKLGYGGPDPLGRSLRRRRAGAIGVLCADRLSYSFTDPAAVMFLEGVSFAAEEAGMGMLLLPGGPAGGREAGAVSGAAVDGFIAYCIARDDPLLQLIVGRGLPMVLVDNPVSGGAPSVGVDDEGGARSAARHLLDLGHRDFGVVSFEFNREPSGGLAGVERQLDATHANTVARLTGYRKEIASSGLDWGDVPVYECLENTPEQGKQAARTLLRRRPHPTAVLALSDQLAFGVMEVIREVGLRIPEDISVVGYDDVPEAARSNPPLTTVHQPHVEKGLLAGRKLIARLEGEENRSSEEPPKTFATRLVVRNSTAPAKKPERNPDETPTQ
ncbi:LacI family DNA-binding transcriptional regulator [Rubrobacter indicoceani]|uniref:LacI family DNA-binding transcriptional regulator n=1 Tax=Rubrobacter indicoceani TaxID=2051957 RepID=UPI000E5C4D0E|nr:LacI family DNA-binding transcriptional regulator [Rubrobacter indicoceani]